MRMRTNLDFRTGEDMEVYIITGMDRGCLSSREVSHTSLEWTDGKILGWQLPILWKKDKTLSKMDRWMSLQQGSFPYFNGMD